MRHIVHATPPAGRPSFNAELIITSNHAATHVDAFGALRTGAGDTHRRHAAGHRSAATPSASTSASTRAGTTSRAAEVEAAVAASAARSCARATSCSSAPTTTTARPARPPSSTASAGISAEAVHWMADRGVKIFGVETISPRPRLPHRRLPDAQGLRRAPADALREPQQPQGRRQPALPVLRPPAAARARLRLADPRRRRSSTTERSLAPGTGWGDDASERSCASLS